MRSKLLDIYMGIIRNHKLDPRRQVNRYISLYCKNWTFNLNLTETNPSKQEIAFTESTFMWPGCQHIPVKFIKQNLTWELWSALDFVLVLYLKRVQWLLKQCFLLQLGNSSIKDRLINVLPLCCRNLQLDKQGKVLQTGFKSKEIRWKWARGRMKGRGKCYFEESICSWYNYTSPIHSVKEFIQARLYKWRLKILYHTIPFLPLT